MKKRISLILFFISIICYSQFSGGTGTKADPYIISNLNDLNFLSENNVYWNKNFSQNSNIDASPTNLSNSGLGFSPIGNYSKPFTGHYDGNGFYISNLFINRPTSDYIGLFGNCEKATFSNINLREVSVTGYKYVGGLIGTLSNPLVVGASPLPDGIVNCSVQGYIKGNDGVGGIGGTVTHCNVKSSYSDSSVKGNRMVGGLFGLAACNISQSYVKGTVEGTNCGGFVGEFYDGIIDNSYCVSNIIDGYGFADKVGLYSRATGILSSCYFAGTISNSNSLKLVGQIVGVGNVNLSGVTDSFWDNDKVNIIPDSNIMASPKSTSELKNLSTYVSHNWNFSNNGIWKMDNTNINNGYPVLRHQLNSLSNNEVSKNEIKKCYVDNNSNVVLLNTNDIAKSQLYSVDGRLIKEDNRTFFNLLGLKSGLYFVQAQDNNGKNFNCKFRYIVK